MTYFQLNASCRFPADDCVGEQTEGFAFADAAAHYSVDSSLETSDHPPEIQAPTLPASSTSLGFRPQRPLTLDLKSPQTPAESGISTAGSSYRSLPSADHVSQDHCPQPPFDCVQRLAPPIPPRANSRRSDDEATVVQRQRLSPVSQSP
ncbi:unnamed protein product [Gongylonema pulchrum]|uniref:Uncharacterized protein n=1 Tax=Gongylonema pulchrum TaxID=637853 RepID=A0A183DNP4_9BILA|nr:unnamed protein product [Gongylonema pulchrum]